MAFWKPGESRPSAEAVDESSVAVYHRYAGLPLGKQRRALPIYEYRLAILYAIEQHGVVVITAETGSGKSTREFWRALSIAPSLTRA